VANQRRDVLRFRLELLGIQPSIWREILVPASYSFWDLHVAIQDAMGWEDYHLHEFQVAEPESGQLLRIGIPDDEGFGTGVLTLLSIEDSTHEGQLLRGHRHPLH
jgi:hypothetical protein